MGDWRKKKKDALDSKGRPSGLTVREELRKIQKHFAPQFDSIDVDNMTGEDFQKTLDYMVEKGRISWTPEAGYGPVSKAEDSKKT